MQRDDYRFRIQAAAMRNLKGVNSVSIWDRVSYVEVYRRYGILYQSG